MYGESPRYSCEKTMEYKRRDIEATLRSLIESRTEEIILLSGARQTGKSTMIENMPLAMPRRVINLWDEERETHALREARTFSEFGNYLRTLFGFVPDGREVLIIDEAQASTHLSGFLMQMHHEWEGQRVVLLGSLLANLYARGMPMPVGRTIELICRPLNFSEFLRFRGKEQYLSAIPKDVFGGATLKAELHELFLSEYELYMSLGGLPGIVAADVEGREVRILLESLLGNLYRDADRFVGDSGAGDRRRTPQYGRFMEHVMRSIATHLGQPTKNSTLLSTDSSAYRTVLPAVMEALQAWHLGYVLRFGTAQLTTKQGYSSKKYLYDTGVANYLANRFLPVKFGQGAAVTPMLLENAVLQDLIGLAGSVDAVETYRANNRVNTELDFVATLSGTLIALEVKSSASVKHNTLSQLFDFCDRNGVHEAFVVYTGLPRREQIRGKQLTCLPPYLVHPHLCERFGKS